VQCLIYLLLRQCLPLWRRLVLLLTAAWAARWPLSCLER
jgi:hypothetical protein